MFFRVLRGALPLVLGLQLCVHPVRAQNATPPVHDVAGTVAALIDEFNQHNPDGVAALWSENAVYVGNATGERLEGQTAIADRYRTLFQEHPDCQLDLKVDAAREITKDVISMEGATQVRYSHGPPTQSEVHILLSKQQGKWLIDEVRESVLASPSLAATHLRPLAWLLGDWHSSSDTESTTHSFAWSGNQSFLVRDFQNVRDGALVHAGVQYIGWDAEQSCLRSWHFDTSGAFGEGVLRPEGDHQWIEKVVFKLPDGQRGSMTNILKRTDDGKLVLQSVDRDTEGASHPNTDPMVFTRATP